MEAALNVLKGLDIGKVLCHAAAAKRYGIERTALAKVTNVKRLLYLRPVTRDCITAHTL